MLFAAQALQCVATGGTRAIDTNCGFEGLFGTVIVAAVDQDLAVIVERCRGQLRGQSSFGHCSLGSRSDETKIICGLITPFVKKREDARRTRHE